MTHGNAIQIIPQMSTGATDGLYFRAAGIPVYGVEGSYGISPDDERAHGLDERLPVKAFYDDVLHWEYLVRTLAGKMKKGRPVPERPPNGRLHSAVIAQDGAQDLGDRIGARIDPVDVILVVNVAAIGIEIILAADVVRDLVVRRVAIVSVGQALADIVELLGLARRQAAVVLLGEARGAVARHGAMLA